MPVVATLLGSATGTGTDLTIPITVSQPAGSLLGVYAMANTGPGQFALSQGFRQQPTDTKAGSWTPGATVPSIGNTGDNAGGVGTQIAGNVLSQVRTAGAALQAGGGGSGPVPKPGCTTCGSELMGLLMRPSTGGGDSVTIYWFNANPGSPTDTVAMVVAIEGLQTHTVATDQSQFGNGDQYPSVGVSAVTLNWHVDLGAASVPTPVADCAVVTLAGAYGTSGWTPVNGSTVSTVTDGTIFLAVSLNTFAASGVAVEPGGSFGGASQYAAANYQTIELV